jgi:carboxyl-terminal processing protease
VSARGWALVCALGGCAVVSCIDVIAPRAPATTPAAIFDQVWTEFDRHYSLFESRGVDWRSVGDHYRPLALGNDSVLQSVLCRMLDTLKDLHVTLYSPGRRCGRGPRRTDAYDPSAITGTSYLAATFTSSASFLLTRGIFAPEPGTGRTVGYLGISGFTDDRLAAEVDSALAFMNASSAIIIDLRLNGGGNASLAESVAGRFVDSSRVYALTWFRDGPAHSDFSGPVTRRVQPAGAQHFNRPVALVINRTVGSAAEDFVMAMMTRANVVLVGDTTSGTATNPLWRDLPNGWAFRLSQSIEYTPGGFAPSIAGGIPPTIFARTTRADSARHMDVPIDTALATLRAALALSHRLLPQGARAR